MNSKISKIFAAFVAAFAVVVGYVQSAAAATLDASTTAALTAANTDVQTAIGAWIQDNAGIILLTVLALGLLFGLGFKVVRKITGR